MNDTMTIKEDVREQVFFEKKAAASFCDGYEFLDPTVTISFNALLLEDLQAAKSWLDSNPSFTTIKKGFDPATSKLVDVTEDESHRFDVDNLNIDKFGVSVQLSPAGCNVTGISGDVPWEEIENAWQKHCEDILVGTPLEGRWLTRKTKEQLALGGKFVSHLCIQKKYQPLAESLDIDMLNYQWGYEADTECFMTLALHPHLSCETLEELYGNAQGYYEDGSLTPEEAAKEVYAVRNHEFLNK